MVFGTPDVIFDDSDCCFDSGNRSFFRGWLLLVASLVFVFGLVVALMLRLEGEFIAMVFSYRGGYNVCECGGLSY
jgi:hypothetical protein